MQTRQPLSFPLSAASRIATGLDILKCVLLPLVPDTLRRAGIDPHSTLPASSPVLKHGFEPDVRAALRMMHAHPLLFADIQTQQIRALSRFRDVWAHQQDLSQSDASKCLQTASELADSLGFEPEARALTHLCQSYEPELGAEIRDQLDQALDDVTRPLTFSQFEKQMQFSDFPADRARLHRALSWLAAIDFIAGRPSPVLAITLGSDETDSPSEVGLPGRSFYWLVGLSHKAPPEIRRTHYQDQMNALDQDRSTS